MKKLLPLFSCLILILIGCGEKKEVGSSGATVTDSPSDNPAHSQGGVEVEVSKAVGAGLSQLPEVITKDFILALWNKEHSDKGLIDELRHRTAGRWTVEVNREGEQGVRTCSGVSKFIDGRFDVTKSHGVTDGKEWVTYDLVTYDSSLKRYRKFELGPDGKIAEARGRLYWRNLMEWRPIQSNGEAGDWVTRETLRNDNCLKGETQFREDGKRVAVTRFKVTFLP